MMGCDVEMFELQSWPSVTSLGSQLQVWPLVFWPDIREPGNSSKWEVRLAGVDVRPEVIDLAWLQFYPGLVTFLGGLLGIVCLLLP